MENAIVEKSLTFAVRIVKLHRCLGRRGIETVLRDQVLRSGTSIGANVREANSAQSRADFISKMSISLKECDETGFWLELLKRTGGVSGTEYDSLEKDRDELFALLTSIIKSAKAK